MVRRCNILFLLFLLTSFTGYGQEGRYIVYFSDKDGNEYSLENPDEYLSVRALERRERQSVVLNELDLPVSGQYLQALAQAGFTPYFPSKWLNAAVVQVTSDKVPEIEALDFVLGVEPGSPAKRIVSGRKNNKFTAESLSAASDSIHYEWHGITQLHQNSIVGEGMMIAILDAGFSGVDVAEPYAHLSDNILMTGNLIDGTDNVFTWSTHGTRVLSIMGAKSPGVFTGIAPESDFLLFITEDPVTESRIEEYAWTIGAEKADSAGADIINTSLGYNLFDDPSMDYSYEDMDGQTAMISRMAGVASSKGMLIVVSAGNAGNSPWMYITAPADADNILAVGAVGADSLRASFSSFGPTADGRTKPDVVSLGVGTPQLNHQGEYSPANGTSFSAPVISGFAALLWSQYPYLTNTELIEIIKLAGHNLIPDNAIGWGIPALPIIQSSEPPAERAIFLYPNPVQDELFVDMAGQIFEVRISDSNGRNLMRISDVSHGIDVSGLAAGIYIVEISFAGGIFRKKFIKY